VVGEVLGIDPDRIRVVRPDSLASLPGNSPVGSRMAIMLGGAAANAARDIARQLVAIGAHAMGVPATEVLLNNGTVAELIRDERDEDLAAAMAGSRAEGMHDFTSSLGKLVMDDWVELKVAERYAPNRDALRSLVKGIQVKADTLVHRVKG